ncbi:unnamed protein product [Lactuca saligna]|uniref:MULE transposase domain-containing protein n=1 Tax=Lactuca saligna TaxID=75948 RepID=A0AA35UR91_LACSI|nr:unnamed protein product [Lactuca saligna]
MDGGDGSIYRSGQQRRRMSPFSFSPLPSFLTAPSSSNQIRSSPKMVGSWSSEEDGHVADRRYSRSTMKRSSNKIGDKYFHNKNPKKSERDVLTSSRVPVRRGRSGDGSALVGVGGSVMCRYRMIFVPFTAIDHHKKSVNVGSGLLSNESIESYSWLLKAFLKTHISDDLFTNTNFRKRFSKLVWDINMKPDVIEVKWGLLIKEFNLEETRWFKDKFTKLGSWIPRYFNDIPMCRLIKTTSKSESMNSFFNTYSESGNLLLNLMMNYETAIQKQKNTQRELDKASKKASYKMQPPQ